MSEEIVVKCCAPTLAGIKTGSLFSCPYRLRGELDGSIRKLNRALCSKGLRVLPLRYSENKALIYMYRPDRLHRDLSNRDALEILTDAGYAGLETGECVTKLMQKLRAGEDFPHEIGLFLSYPPEDVRGFIENKAQNYKFTGLWKVYGDEQKARRLFEKYKKCTDSYCRRLEAGCSVEQLAV